MGRSFRLLWLITGFLPGCLFGQIDPAAPGLESRAGIVRPLTVFQTRYRLRAGEPAKIDAPPETLDFLLHAKSRHVRIDGKEARGIVVGPNRARDQMLLAASLTMKPGEYTVTLSAVSEAGEERAADVDVTLDPMQPVPSNSTVPPVVLLNGWQRLGVGLNGLSTCPTSTPEETFGQLGSELMNQNNVPVVYWFDNCVEDLNGPIEDLGNILGDVLNLIRYTNGTLVPEVDLVSHSMGGLIVRAYLAGMQSGYSFAPPANSRIRKFVEIATPNFGSFLAANYYQGGVDLIGTQALEMLPGSKFLWQLNTWNQGTDDLRGVDALAIIGDEGTWPNSSGSPGLSDGVVSITSASINFARDASRTRIVNHCHIASSADSLLSPIDCVGDAIAMASETIGAVLSFLADDTAGWTIGATFSTNYPYGGALATVENTTQYVNDVSQVQFDGSTLTQNPQYAIFSGDFLRAGQGTVQFVSASLGSLQATRAVPSGTYADFRLKLGPFISSVVPLQQNTTALIVTSGGSITINGYGFGQQCSGCQVLAASAGSTTYYLLPVSSWSDGAISASFLPATMPNLVVPGLVIIYVELSSSAWDSINIMAASLSPTIVVTPASFQFACTVGGTIPAAKSIQVTNSGGGTLNWSATTSATWLSVAAASGTAPSTLSVLVSPTGLGAGTYTGSVQISAAGASNSPVSVTVTLTVAPAPPVLAVSPQALAFNYTVGGTIPAAKSIQVTNSGGGTLNWSATTSASWLSVASASGTAPSTLSVLVSPTGLGAGTYTSSVQISATGVSNSPVSVAVTLTVAPAPPVLTISPQALAFNYTVGGTIPAAQGISITNTGGGALSWIASASATWVGLSPASGTAPATLSVSANPATLAAGSYSATVLVTAAGATGSPASVSVTLVVQSPQPTITGAGVSGGGANIAQNAWIEIYGSDLAPGSVGAGLTWSSAPSFATGQMPTSLGGVSVTVNGKPAYVYFVSAAQVNVLTPLDSTIGSVAIEVNNGSATSAAFTANLQAAAPGFLRFSDGIHIAALHANYTYLGPASMSVPGYTFTPAAPGETILLFGDGFGLPVSTLTAGSAVQTGPLPTLPQVTIGGTAADVQWAGLISPGLYQINVLVPSNAASGDNQVIATYAGASSPSGAMIPVSQ
jgi:uncharacterized protein (TIGR03437 family)